MVLYDHIPGKLATNNMKCWHKISNHIYMQTLSSQKIWENSLFIIETQKDNIPKNKCNKDGKVHEEISNTVEGHKRQIE